jgi:uncharacterized protein YqcC (DUF446 family)
MEPQTDAAAAATKLDQIEAEMRRIGMWSEKAPSPETFESRQAFFGDTMAFEQWLQFVFLPHAREAADGTSPFPKSSSVGAYAVRQFDGRGEAQHLGSLLSEFDELIHG